MSIGIIIAVWIGMAVGFVLGAAWAGRRQGLRDQQRAARQMYKDNMEDYGNDYRH